MKEKHTELKGAIDNSTKTGGKSNNPFTVMDRTMGEQMNT